MIIGTTTGVITTTASSYFNGVNPFTGNKMWPSNNGFSEVNPEMIMLKKGFSYYHTWYNYGDKQRTGTIGYRNKDFSLKWENDLWGDTGDRFRSNATEIGYKGYVVGANVYTNEVEKREVGASPSSLFGRQIARWIGGKAGSEYYKGGVQSSSPFYIGKRTGRNITRIGYNHPFFGDLTQDGAHWIVNSPYFSRGAYSLPFLQQGTYTPYSLY